jgi:hypothetical protein
VIPTAVAIVYRQELQDHGNRHTDNSRRQDLQDLPSGELAERIGPVACPVGRVEHIAQVAGRGACEQSYQGMLRLRRVAAASGLNANRSQREARTAFFAMAAGLVSSRPLLMSNCAPDRLRRLSVDADKCPSHVFRVTEPDRLRDAFDRFDSRLYPASG